MKFLYVCSSNKDRSPALEKYIGMNNDQHEHCSVGVNKYFCDTHSTSFITKEHLKWADVIVCMEYIHFKRIKELFNIDETMPGWEKRKVFVVLNNGEYTPNTSSAEDWLMRAEDKISYYLKIQDVKDFQHKIQQNPYIYE